MKQPSVVAFNHSEHLLCCLLTSLRKACLRFSLLSVMLFLVSFQALSPAQAFASDSYVGHRLPIDSSSTSTFVFASAFTPRLAVCCIGTNCDIRCRNVGCRRCPSLVAAENPYADAINKIYYYIISFISGLKGHQ
jgi:hypothetical protein